MRAYEVKGNNGAVRYGGTGADAKDKRDSLMDKYGLRKKDVVTIEIDIPTAKNDLLDFINGLVAKSDPSVSTPTPASETQSED